MVANANILCCTICICASVLCWIISIITKNHSQVDKLWSIMPIIYSWICVNDIRTLFMAFLVTIWGIRLTYNFYRRGGYNGLQFHTPWKGGEEDYRWLVLKGQTQYKLPFPFTLLLKNRMTFELFNIFFISIYQHVLLLCITSPSLVAWNHSTIGSISIAEAPASSSLTLLDLIASCLVLFFIVIETIADKQQYNFQRQKKEAMKESNDKSVSSSASASSSHMQQQYIDGFCQSGLFAIVRKPNYAAEQAIWCSYYLFSISSSDYTSINWSINGCLQLILLFQGSGWITEWITQQKYPSYKQYQQSVPLYVPSPRILLSYIFTNRQKTKNG